MRSEKFHLKNEKPSPLVVDEASRLTVEGTEPVNLFQVDDNGKKIKLLKTGTTYKVKLNDIEEVILESKGDFNSIIEGPDKLDNTPLEEAVEKPLTQTQQLRMWLQNEENMRNYAKQELTWEEFKDLGDLDDGDEFYSQFNQDMTKYEMQAEAMRQETNPLRGNPISDHINSPQTEDKADGNSKGDTQTTSESNINTNNSQESRPMDDKAT